MIWKHNIDTKSIQKKNIDTILQSVNTKIFLENQEVYKIACGDKKTSYIGQTNKKIQILQNHQNVPKKNEKTWLTLNEKTLQLQRLCHHLIKISFHWAFFWVLGRGSSRWGKNLENTMDGEAIVQSLQKTCGMV